MKHAGGRTTPKIIQLIRQAQGLDPEEESILKKLTPHVPGVVTFADHNKLLPWTTEYRSVLVFADISGFTSLCERYASMEKSGIDQLTKNLNDYLGAMVDLILRADGDVLKFAGDAILSLWRVNTPKDLLNVVEKVIRCCLNIQKNCGEWKTDIGVILTVKLGISVGNTLVTFLGNDTFRMYVERGQPVTDVNTAESFCKSGYIVLSPYVWEICRKPLFTFEVLEDGEHVRVLSMKDDFNLLAPTIEITPDDERDDTESVAAPTNYLTKFKGRKLSVGSSANIKIMANRLQSKVKRPAMTDGASTSDVAVTSASPYLLTVEPTITSPATFPSLNSVTSKETINLVTPSLGDNSSLPNQLNVVPTNINNSKTHQSISNPLTTQQSSPQANKGLAMGRLAKLRNVAKQVAQLKLDQSLRLYVLSPVLRKIDDNQPLEYLSEMRKVSIAFMNLVLNEDFDATILLQQVFDTVYLQSSIMHGCLNKAFLFDKGCTFLVIFGLPGYKHERDCAHALMCSYKMRKTLVKIEGVKNVSIGVTTGTTFCGVIGHKNRHEYSVIGSKVNMAARLMTHYPDKITCDDNTFQFSRLPTNSFQVLITKRMKGLRNIGLIREYTESDAVISEHLNSVTRFQYPLLGRIYENNVFYKELCRLTELENSGSYTVCQHFVFVGAAGIGKTRLLDHLIVKAEKTGTRVISCMLKLDNLFDANFLAKYIILTLLNSAGFSYQVNKEPLLMDSLKRAGYIPALHKLNNILSSNMFETDRFGDGRVTVWGGISHGVKSPLVVVADILTAARYRDEIIRPHVQLLQQSNLTFQQDNAPPHCIEKLGGAVIALDDAHHIDPKSWMFLLLLINVPGVIVVSTVRPLAVEAPSCSAASEFFDCKMVKLLDIAGLESKFMTALACQLMEVSRIPKELERMLREMTHGVPSWCEQLLVDMVEKKQLTILQYSGHFKHFESMVAPPSQFIRRLDTDDDTSDLDLRQCNKIFCKSSSIISQKSESGHNMLADLGFIHREIPLSPDEDKENNSKIERVAVFSPGINPNEIQVPESMKELIMTRIDSMRASEQLIVKCAAVLGTSFSRDMVETILPRVQRVKARKCFKQLAYNGIFECANIPAGRYNQMMQGRDDTISWDTCYCVKEENLYVQDLCNKMRFRNALIQQTAYEILMESQRLELHAKAAEYLEKQADKYRSKIPYYLLGRNSANSEKELIGSDIAIRKARWKKRSSRVEDISSNLYQQTRGRRFGFSLDTDKRDPLVQVLREQFSLNQTTDEMIECLLPTYKMIIYHWKAAKCYQNLVEQLLEAASATVVTCKAEQAMDMMEEVDSVLKKMEEDKQTGPESLVILKSRANRLWAKTFQLVGREEQCYTCLKEAARLVGLKQPDRMTGVKLKMKFLKLKMFFIRNRDARMLPASKSTIEQCYCLLDLYSHYQENDNTQSMVLCALLHLSKILNRIPLLHQVVQGYYVVMKYYKSQKDKNMEIRLGLELIERCIGRYKELTKSDCVLMSQVYSDLCTLSLETGNVTQALNMGFSCIDLSKNLRDDTIKKETGLSLGFALLLAHKVDLCIDILLMLKGAETNRITRSWYYALCLELVLNGGGFHLRAVQNSGPEQFHSCLTYSTNLFKNVDAVRGECPSRYHLAMCMAMYYCRRKNWKACQRWFDYWELYRTTEISFFPLYTICKEVEIKLLSLSATHSNPNKGQKSVKASIHKDLDFLMRSGATIQGLKPRVLHLKSYYCALCHKPGKAMKNLSRASTIAWNQGNQSEWRWIEHHKQAWFNTSNEFRQQKEISGQYLRFWGPQRGNLFTWPAGINGCLS
ncbi:adenylate cyclase type 10-like [Ylistrum balloti]|uniref:adenylate cyclase type 10-like n=1 Tax=Ylistrum balloti TaxID=509963 RepID=UPI0029059CA9|nr:adenylate cyclase type 10-like [Ylistrum balloti]